MSKQHEERTAAITQAAREIAAAEGMSALSVRRVAAASGIGASTLRYYFPNQRALHEAVVHDLLDTVISDDAMNDTTPDVASRLTDALMQFLPRDNPGIAALESVVQATARALGPEADAVTASAYRAMVAAAKARIRTWLQQLESEGAFAGDTDDAVYLIVAFLDGLGIHLLAADGELTIERARDLTHTFVTRTILAA